MLLVALLISTPVSAASARPAPAAGVHSAKIETRLNYLVGDWKLQDLPTTVFRQKCDWYAGRAFVLCAVQDSRTNSTGQAIFGYSALQKRFTLYQYDSRGRGTYKLGFPTGNYGIVFTEERQVPEGIARIQTTYNLEDEGLKFTEYRSLEGREWQRTADILYVPARTSPRRRQQRK